MRSSTSSSSHRAPEGPWTRTWMVALAVVLALLGSVELGFRARGLTPHYQDTPRHWAYWRGQVVGDPDVIVLAGSSRTQLGVDPDAMQDALGGRRVVNLAVNGATPLPVLEDLAADVDFVGTVVVEGYPAALFVDDDQRRQAMQSWLDFYHGRSWIDDIEARIRATLQGSLVVARPDFRPTLFAVTLLVHRRLPIEGYTKMHFNRWVSADYSEPHPDNEDWTIPHESLLDDAALRARFARIERDVAAIEQRGGKVFFFRMPSSGHVREIESELLPRERYWDEFVRQTGVTALHFEDVPAFRGISTGDGGHLDMRDVPGFSRELAIELRQRGWLDVADTSR